ncbi:hypothetical protein EH165_13505 [Nakamurella antarctica]|uniref:Uncharacterized protein n=1 Tax=Nakamurella antarctica TaxID=1902245 RepID=A0A3G8ZNU7_9ACTN|nr:hypothetical protein EH165_13505 [Nakamurella antarctica]
MPCGQPATFLQFPNVLRAGTNVVLGQSVQFQEAVNLYVDAATASAAYDYAVAGLACGDGKIGSTAVTISEPEDVTATVGGDSATTWTVGIEGETGVLVSVLSGPLIINFTFIAAAGADSSALPDPLELAKAATAKLIAAGG